MLLERACGLLLKYSRYGLGTDSEYPLDTESTKDLRRKQTPGSSQEVVFEGGAAEFREGSEAGSGSGGVAGAESDGGGGGEGSNGSTSKAQLQARARAKVVLRIDQVVGIMFQAGVTPSAKFTNIAMTAYR